MRHTKIIATLGPATANDAAIRDLLVSGVDVFRLNFSHGTREEHGELIGRVRRVSEEVDRPVALLQDLSGPKIRIGRLVDASPLVLNVGDELRIAVSDAEGGSGRVTTTYADLPKAVRAGDTLLLDDGRIELRVEESDGQELRTTVVDGGVLGEHKGINAPGVALPSGGLTPKDAEDLRFGVRAGVDLVAISFVQGAGDLRAAREALEAAGAPGMPLVAKLERPEAIAHLDDILGASDAVMVARGDLGLELPLERVPRIQKEVTRRARELGIPVIVATQVLESMRSELRPTRAEVSDAANAVDDGVDAIMLAGETAVGAYPVRVVQTLDAIIRDAETIPRGVDVAVRGPRMLAGHGLAVCEAAVTLAERSDASAIVAVTGGGMTARLLSALRPCAAIYAATDRPEVARRLALVWGVVPVPADLSGDVGIVAGRLGETLVERGAIAKSSVIVLVSVVPDLTRGAANFLKLQRV